MDSKKSTTATQTECMENLDKIGSFSVGFGSSTDSTGKFILAHLTPLTFTLMTL